jgi:hypothetical protein
MRQLIIEFSLEVLSEAGFPLALLKDYSISKVSASSYLWISDKLQGSDRQSPGIQEVADY